MSYCGSCRSERARRGQKNGSSIQYTREKDDVLPRCRVCLAANPTSAPPSEVVLGLEPSNENKSNGCNTRPPMLPK